MIMQIKKWLIELMKDLVNLKSSNQPFLLSVGFLKPHLPFNAPLKYWDLYDKKDIQLAKNRFQPKILHKLQCITMLS